MSRPAALRKQIAALGGAARARKLSAERRQAIARAGYLAMLAKRAKAAAAQATDPTSSAA